ncbi:MAG: tetratricopeptide repeat protein [Deltaproteobacteria bacterium]|nr:tetratricopeptide repeat protein [Deltaproteobacteria bacterium]
MAETNHEKSREEDFYYLLTEGSEHLQGGRIDEARVHFERALLIHPKNEQALNLLGLSLFRLGQLERARQLFAELVHGNPVEPSLRLNLAMVFLKQGRLDDAHKELSHVLDLNPDHPRAASYMGLVLEKKGQLERAADYYERAGNKKRADQIRAFNPTKTGTFPIPNLAAMGVQSMGAAAPGPAAMRAASTAPAASSLPPAPPATLPAPPTSPPAPATSPPTPAAPLKPATMTLAAVQVNVQGQAVPAKPPPAPPARPSATGAMPAVSTTPAPATTPPTPASMAPAPASLPPTPVGDGHPRRAAAARAPSSPPPAPPPPPAVAAGPAAPTPTSPAPVRGVVELAFADLGARALDGKALTRGDEGHLVFPVVDNGYVRSDLITGLSGAFDVEVVHRRYRGKRTDSLFGGADAAVTGLAGRGFALLSLGELLATALTLNQDECYLIESAVVGFGSGLVWENGRLPSETDRDLDIVHLRGSGRVVLGTKRPVVTFAVTKDAPCMVHASRLVGWSGQLLPFRAPLPGLSDAARRVPVVRFEGIGIVLAV